MLIRELEQKTGLERATIRFYEKEGLIAPHREENGYRTYTTEDLEMLLKIKLLRQLGLPLEIIKAIQQGCADFSQALSEQIAALEKQLHNTERAKAVCIDIRSTGASFDELDAKYYLDVLSNYQAADRKWNPQPVPEFHKTVPAHPWKRFLARTIDLNILNITLFFALVVVFRIRPVNHTVYTLLGIEQVVFLLWIPLEGLLLHYFGTTPGKWIFGIRIESANGGYLTIRDAFLRTWSVFCYGYGFQIPIYGWWRLYKCYKEYNVEHYVRWDNAYDAEVQFTCNYEFRKKVLIGVIALAYILAAGTCIADSIKPIHRGGDLTIAQIAENYNIYLETQAENPSASAYLKEDGTFQKELGTQGSGVVVVIGTQAVNPNANFEFVTENGFVRSVTYQQSYTDIMMLQPVGHRQVYMILAVAGAQDWFHFLNYQEFVRNLDFELKKPSGKYSYENIEIRWETVAENCVYTGSFYFADDENKPSSVDTKFEIIIHGIS